MAKVSKFLKNKITIEVYIISIIVLLIIGSSFPFTSIGGIGNNMGSGVIINYTYFGSNYNYVTILVIIGYLFCFLLALLDKQKIIRILLFVMSIACTFAYLVLIVEYFKYKYEMGKTSVEVAMYLYGFTTFISVVVGMGALSLGVKTFRKDKVME